MKRSIMALLMLVLVAGSAQALETRDLVALAAMPLAVATVSEVSGVPPGDLVNVVTAMNRAAVPAPQFVEIVRYTPVALVDDTMDPPFVRYATTQYERGLYGDAYAVSLADRLELYGVEEIDVVQPVAITPAYVVERQYVPAYVTTRIEQRFDPLALIAMPLAVAAVSEIAGIPSSDLFSFVSALNRAYVPAPQFVEIVRYSPVAFFDDRPRFVRYVTGEVDRGIVRTALVRSIEDRYRDDYGFSDVDFFEPAPARIVERAEYVPPPVVARLERSGHPLGGPPGQLKKQLGLQTGAEVVHGERTGRARAADRGRTVVVERDRQPDRRTRAATRDQTPRRVVRERGERRPAKVDKPRGRSGERSARSKKDRPSSQRLEVRRDRPEPRAERRLRAGGGESSRGSLRQSRSGRVNVEKGSGRKGGHHESRGKGRKKG